MDRTLLLLILVLQMYAWIKSITAVNETIVKVPHKVRSSCIWSWTGKWTKRDDVPGRVPYYAACDTSLQQDRWIRSDRFLDNNAARIDVTVQYAVIDCSSMSLPNCKQNLKLFIYKTNILHNTGGGSNGIPEPSDKPELYQHFATTSPANLTSSGILLRENLNTETYSFDTNYSTPLYYLAIKYEGGCFALYSVTISYSVCPLLALPSGLIQLPRTISPASGSIRVSGSCPANAQLLASNMTLYGECYANGEWSSNVTSGECWCKAGYGKYLTSSGAECKECSGGNYQDKASSKECKPCPLNSVQDVTRTRCNCSPSFYRTKNESIFDNCTGPPSAPRDVRATFKNSSFVTLEWTTPLDLGGRSDVYYHVECNKCNNEGRDCNIDCRGAFVTHTPRTSRKSTVQHLSAYTYYQLKVFSKNGVSHLAEMNGEKSKYGLGTIRTGQSVPTAPVLEIKIINSTSVLLSWTLQQTNGIITNYQVMYYRVGQKTKKSVLYTTEATITITGMQEGLEYYFQVRASTSVGLGPATSKMITLNKEKKTSTNGSAGENKINVTVPVLVTIVVLLLVVMAIFIVVYIVRKKKFSRQDVDRKKKGKDFPESNVHGKVIVLEDIPGETSDNYAYILDDSLWEVLRENVSVIKRLGSGNFGYVDKAAAIGLYGHPGQVTVAVKTLKENASAKDQEDFLTELQLMMQLERHPRVVELLGCCTKSEGPMSIILEYLPYGDLLGYLRRSRGHEDMHCSGDLRPEGKLTSRDLLQFSWMIADGMSFLAQNKCVHRDLAARNVLVGENKICKISDLGLARTIREDVYTRSKAARLPIKWMPPESVFHGQSSIASDVWSFGIVLWEIFTLGDSPYPKYKGKDIPRLLQQGYRMTKPLHLSDTLYSLMLRCWQDKPEDRPSFSLLCDEINTYYNSTQDYINLDVFEDRLYVNFDIM